MIATMRSQEILLPVSGLLIACTILAALLLNLAPWPALILDIRPDFCALILVYWGIHQPRRIAFTLAFALGLMVDIADASLFGQHALAYVVLLFSAIVLHRRVLNFNLSSQVLHVLPLLLAADVIALAVRLLAGDEPPPATHFFGALIAAGLWVPISLLIRMSRLPKADPSHA